jgi:hypothetical protein
LKDIQITVWVKTALQSGHSPVKLCAISGPSTVEDESFSLRLR